MLGSTFIEAAIGLSLLFLLMSLMCSVVCEMIARVRRSRARYLFEAIEGLVKSRGLADEVDEHVLIRALGTGTGEHRHKPSYIPSALFARVVIELSGSRQPIAPPALALPAEGNVMFTSGGQAAAPARGTDEAKAEPKADAKADADATADAKTKAIAEAKAKKEKKANLVKELREVRTSLVPTLDPKAPDEELLAIAAWFDAAMERLSGRYKRSTQLTVFALAVPLTLGLNVDALVVANRLQRDKSLRDTVVASATTFANDHKDLGALDPSGQKLNDPAAPITTSDARGRLLALQVQIEHLDLPIGWLSDDDVATAMRRAADADRALGEAREDAKVPEALWLQARAELATAGTNLVATPKPAEKKDGPTTMEVYTKAKTAASAARDVDAAAKKAVADALMASEHSNLEMTEMKARALILVNPLDWTCAGARRFALRLTGWLLTMIAVALGTRFWFDTLNKLVSIRSGVKPEEKKA